jgi:hypothetical protein
MDTVLEVQALRKFDDSYRRKLYEILELVGCPFTEQEKTSIRESVSHRKIVLLSKVGTWWIEEGAILYKSIMSLNVSDDDQPLVEKLQEHLRLLLQVICQTVESHIVALILDDEILEKLENPWSLK